MKKGRSREMADSVSEGRTVDNRKSFFPLGGRPEGLGGSAEASGFITDAVFY